MKRAKTGARMDNRLTLGIERIFCCSDIFDLRELIYSKDPKTKENEMDAEKLKEILELHKKFLNDEEGGERANLAYADLTWE